MRRSWPTVLAFGILFVPLAAHGLETLTVPAHVWDSLAKPEQADLKGAFEVRIVPIESYGVTVDGQMLDRSQPGSAAGSQLGAAVGSAVYIDRAFSGPTWNYSATRHIGAELLGALIGSLANAPPTSEYLTRYYVRLLSGKVIVVDERRSDGFRLPIGVCVETMPIRLAREPFCEVTKADLLARLGGSKRGESEPEVGPVTDDAQPLSKQPVPLVTCKIGNSLPARLERAACIQAGGMINE